MDWMPYRDDNERQERKLADEKWEASGNIAMVVICMSLALGLLAWMFIELLKQASTKQNSLSLPD